MDDRQAQIKEGAGLEDSRINTEFLDFLSKWSTPFFLVLLIGAAGMWGYKRYEEGKIAAIDQAYLEYDLAISGGNPMPATLALLGENHMDTRSVGLMAKLDEADIYFNSARTGLAPSSQLDPITGQPAAEDILNQEQIDSYLQSAGLAYATVLEAAETDSKPVFAVAAAFGSASVLGSQGDISGAKAMYTKAGAIASAAGFALLEAVAAERAEKIESLPEVTVYETADLPELPSNDELLDAITQPFDIDPIEGAPDDAADEDPSVTDPAGTETDAATEGEDTAGAETPAEAPAETPADSADDVTEPGSEEGDDTTPPSDGP